MSVEERDQWLTEALATRDLERVQPNMGAAGDRINDARRHIAGHTGEALMTPGR